LDRRSHRSLIDETSVPTRAWATVPAPAAGARLSLDGEDGLSAQAPSTAASAIINPPRAIRICCICCLLFSV
jgi:hypothetical protein